MEESDGSHSSLASHCKSLLGQYPPAVKWFDTLEDEEEVILPGYDVLIGQTAVTLDTPLYTFNQKHYQFVPGLQTVQPYERGSQ